MSGRTRVLLFVAVAVIAVGGAVLSTRTDSRTKVAGTLAPTPGPSSEGYVEGKRAYLSEAARSDPTKPAAGMASLNRLTTAEEVNTLAGDVRVTAVFVLPPGGEPLALPVRNTIDEVIEEFTETRLASYQDELDALLAADGDADRIADLQVWTVELADGCVCVYAVVLHGATLQALDEMQFDPLVRFVDVPDPVTDDLAGFQLTPLVPNVDLLS